MIKLQAYLLKDIAAKGKYALNGGPFGSKLVSRDYVDEGVPVIRGTNLPDDSRFSTNGFAFVSEQKADALRPNNAHPGDLIFTQRGTLGQIGLIPRDCPYRRFVISQSQMKLTVDERKVIPEFIYYYFRAPSTIKQILDRSFSSGVPHINLDILRNFPVLLQDLARQSRIASILSAYDDLIENNTRRIGILEEMARALYQEWFVHFRFPGHEHVPLVDSPLGPIPTGWEVLPFGHIAGFARGRSYRSSELIAEGGKPFINLKCIDRDGGFRKEGLKRYQGPFKPEQVVSKGDIVMAVTDMTQERRIIAQSGRIATLDESQGVISMDVIKIIPNNGINRDFIYAVLRWSKLPEEVKYHANGANVLHLNPRHVLAYLLPVPSRQMIAAYARVCALKLELIDILQQKNDNLRTTRDLLLPKLISGEIDVSALPEEPVAEAAD